MAQSNDNIFANARYTEVYLKIGRFDDGSNRFKLVKAPFSLLHIAGNPDAVVEMHLEPCGFGGDATGVYQSDNLDYQTYQGRQGMGWLTGNSIIVDPAEMGDESDGWRGLHCFGMI